MRISVGCSLMLVAACGGSSPMGGGGNPQPNVVNVSMTDNSGMAPFAFSQAMVTVPVGTTIKWTNHGTVTHTTTSDDAMPIWDSGNVLPPGTTTCPPNDPYCQPGSTPGGTYTRTFMAAGTYQYHCNFHGAQGMTGTITVTPTP